MSSSRRSIKGLDSSNFFLSNVRDGLGPYLAIYLIGSRNWNPSDIGLAMAIPGLVRIIFQTPVGYLIDKTQFKKQLLFAASVLIGLYGLLVIFYQKK